MDINEKRTGLSERLKASHNSAMERLNLTETPGKRKRRYKNIIQDLGERMITLEELGEGTKNIGVLDSVLSNGGSLDDYVILQQFAKAIIEGDTRAAEFLRDTSGQKPTTGVDLVTNGGGLAEMSTEDLMALKESLEAAKENEKDE